MGIFVIKLVKNKGYMLRMQYPKFRKKIYLFKTWYPLFKMTLITLAPLTPAFIKDTRKNNADLGPIKQARA